MKSIIRTDFLVLGSGIAGLRAALGLERHAEGLRAFLAFLAPLREGRAGRPADRTEAEDRSLADVAWTMAVSALFREESRGAHSRTDFPTADEPFRGHTLIDAAGPRLVDVDVPVPSGARC